MEMHMVYASTVKHKHYHKTFVLQNVISHLDTYLLPTHEQCHAKYNYFRNILADETFEKLILKEFHV